MDIQHYGCTLQIMLFVNVGCAGMNLQFRTPLNKKTSCFVFLHKNLQHIAEMPLTQPLYSMT